MSVTERKIAIAVDLSDESAYAVRWAVENYLRPGDTVILLHVRPTCVLYGADWGSTMDTDEELDAFTASKASDLAGPLEEAGVPFRIHIVKDHDMKERLCLEVERLGLSAVVMGSRGGGKAASSPKIGLGRLGSVSDYCVHHCVCPVVVVRLPEDDRDDVHNKTVVQQVELQPVPEEEEVYHDASESGHCLS